MIYFASEFVHELSTICIWGHRDDLLYLHRGIWRIHNVNWINLSN